MTNKEDINADAAYNARLAAIIALHLVRQILDDACVIATAAVESGQPWHDQSMIKNVAQCETDNEDHEEVSHISENTEDNIVNENNMELIANIVATSTPQKVTGDFITHEAATSYIGQGDERLDMRREALNESSTFKNHIFDMSEVEKLVESNDTKLAPKHCESYELFKAIKNLTDSYIDIALGVVFDQVCHHKSDTAVEMSGSDYSLLCDAFTVDIGRDTAFYINDTDDAPDGNNNCELTHIAPSIQVNEVYDQSCEELMKDNEVARFENAYLSLNRDYEQFSEDNGNVILEDPKGMTLQEVQLLTENSSEGNLSAHDEAETRDKFIKSKELTAVSAVSAASKKSLVNRCRTHGARLLACLRGWWRRRTPGKRKEHQHRVSGGFRGPCPLSPDARLRAASLIDQRLLRSPSPSRSVVWKFNTVNEALVNSSYWKEYSFEKQIHECAENK